MILRLIKRFSNRNVYLRMAALLVAINLGAFVYFETETRRNPNLSRERHLDEKKQPAGSAFEQFDQFCEDKGDWSTLVTANNEIYFKTEAVVYLIDLARLRAYFIVRRNTQPSLKIKLHIYLDEKFIKSHLVERVNVNKPWFVAYYGSGNLGIRTVFDVYFWPCYFVLFYSSELSYKQFGIEKKLQPK